MQSKFNITFSNALALAAASIGFASLVSSASAAVVTFSGAAGTTVSGPNTGTFDWNTTGNWNPNTTYPGFAVGQTALFDAAPSATVNVSASPANAIRGISIGNGGGVNTAPNTIVNIATLSLTGAQLTLAGNVETDAVSPTSNVTSARTVFYARSGLGAASFSIANDLILNNGGANAARFNLAGVNKSLTLSGVISNGGLAVNGNNKGFAKDGDGVLTLTNASNSYVGQTEIIGGTLVLGGNAAAASGVLGTGPNTSPVLLGTGSAGSGTGSTQAVSLLTNGSYSVDRDITVTNTLSSAVASIGTNATAPNSVATYNGAIALGRTTTLLSTNNGLVSFAGVLSGAGGVIKDNAGTVQLNNAGNSYTGTTQITAGQLVLGGNAGLTSGVLGNNSTAVILGTGGTGGSQNVQLLTSGAFNVDRDITVTNTGSTGIAAIGTNSAGNAASTYTGAISLARTTQLLSSGTAGVIFSGPISGAGGIIKGNAGTVRLNGTNTYAGTTLVSAGRLLVNGTNSGTGAFSISSLATLGGTGSIAGDVTSDAGSIIAPGVTLGQLTVANANINGSLTIDVTGADAGSADVLHTAALVLGGTATLDFTTAGPLDDAAYVFATYSSLDTLNFDKIAHVNGVPSGYTVDYHYNGNQLALVSVPEPGVAILTVFAIGFASQRQRRRRESARRPN